MASALLLTTPGPTKVYCHGARPDGSRCRNQTRIAEILADGRVVVRHDGREHDVTGRSTTCPRCGTRRDFAEAS